MSFIIERLEIRAKKFSLICENLPFDSGDKVLLVAPNGSGKSMFLKGITGLIETQKRRIKINNNEISKLNLSDYMAAYVGEEFLIPFYEPQEYFELIGKIKGLREPQLKQAIEQISELFKKKWPKKYIRELSTGLRKIVGLAGSLIGDPQIILWDEPFENIDDEARDILKEFIKDEKRLVFFSSPVKTELPFTTILTIQSGQVLIENPVS